MNETTLADRCRGVSETDRVGLCYQLPINGDDLLRGLEVQRQLTQMLRATLGEKAELIPVFIATHRLGEQPSDFATAWGATEVDG